MGPAQASDPDLRSEHDITAEYEIAADGARSAASHRWLGNFYLVKRTGMLTRIKMDVDPTGASRYDIWLWKMTRNGAADYERDSTDDGTRIQLAEVPAGATTLDHELATPWPVEAGDYIWAGTRSNQSNGHNSVAHDVEATERLDLLDFVGWTQADDTGGIADALTGNLWHDNPQDSAFHARFTFETVARVHALIEKDGLYENGFPTFPVFDFRGENIVLGQADGGRKTTVSVTEPAAATVDFDAGGLEQMHSSEDLTVVSALNWNAGSDTPDFTWPTIPNDEVWAVFVEHIEHSAHEQLPLVYFRGSAVNSAVDGVHNTAHGAFAAHCVGIQRWHSDLFGPDTNP